jgi:hypothetical protein
MASAWDGQHIYPTAIQALNSIKDDGHLLFDPAHVIWAHHDTPASTGMRRPAGQAVMTAIAALSQDEADILAVTLP